MGWVVPPNCPLVGGMTLFSMGRVKSGWLSKFWYIPVLFQMVSEWSGHHWMHLTGCPMAQKAQLLSLWPELFAEIPGPSTIRQLQ